MGVSIKYFINNKFVKRQKLSLLELVKLINLRLINKEIVGTISYIAKIILLFEDYLKELYYLITLLIKFNIILKMLQIKLYNSYISFKERLCTFNLDHYKSKYLKHYKPIIIRSPSKTRIILLSLLILKYKDIIKILVYTFTRLVKRKEN